MQASGRKGRGTARERPTACGRTRPFPPRGIEFAAGCAAIVAMPAMQAWVEDAKSEPVEELGVEF
jgi:hypothetical protein